MVESIGQIQTRSPLTDSDSKTLAVFGVTGSGKSTILNMLSGSTSLFKVGNGLTAKTAATARMQREWNGYTGAQLVTFIDTQGFGDYTNETQQFKKFFNDFKSGVNVVLYLIDIQGSRTSTTDIQCLNFLQNFFGQDFCNNHFFIVINQIDKLQIPPTKDAMAKYSQELIEVCHDHCVKINPNMIVFREDDKEFSTLILAKLNESRNMKPQLADQITALMNEMPHLTVEGAILELSNSAPALKEVIRKQFEGQEKTILNLDEQAKKLEAKGNSAKFTLSLKEKALAQYKIELDQLKAQNQERLRKLHTPPETDFIG